MTVCCGSRTFSATSPSRGSRTRRQLRSTAPSSPRLGELGDVDGETFRLEHGSGEQSDGARSADDGDLTRLRAGSDDRMVGHGERFDEGSLIEWDVTDRMDPPPLNDDLFGQTTAATTEPDEVHVLRQLIVLPDARIDIVADDEGLDDDILAHFKISHTLAEAGDRS